MEFLIDNIEIERAATQFAAADLQVPGKMIDMANAEGCLFIVVGSSHHTCNHASTFFFKLYGSTDSAHTTGNYHPYSTAFRLRPSLVANAPTSAQIYQGKCWAIDVQKPKYQYLALGVANTTLKARGITSIAIKYGLRNPGSTKWVQASTFLSHVGTSVITPSTKVLNPST